MAGILNLLDTLLGLVFPPKCALCKAPNASLICDSCLDSLPLIEDPNCNFCGKPTLFSVDRCRECRGKRWHFNWARSVWIYRGRGKDLIHAFKYENERRLAAMLAEKALESLPTFADIDIITWVPLHPARKADRGYNQAELIAREMARLSAVSPVAALKRKRNTEDQNKLAMEKRKANVRDAFSLVGDVGINGKKVLLIDDVYTTGSTANECSRILKKGGAASVGVLTLARAVLER